MLDDALLWVDMAEYAFPEFSKREVIEAGDALKGKVQMGPEALRVFRIAHNWRASHAWPMHHLRLELSGKARSLDGRATTAGRLKRMVSIRKKLAAAPHNLYQMQDLGGCRAVVDTMADVRHLADRLRHETRHNLNRDQDYISNPKRDGYRCHHLVFRYLGLPPYEAYNSNSILIELQLRTRLQHAWATAVEAVGMVRNEDLKGGSGDPTWLRFFALAASCFADMEDCPPVPGTPEEVADRRKELVDLNKRLGAISKLEGYANAIKFTEGLYRPRGGSPYFLLQFDPEHTRVTVSPLMSKLSESYATAEGYRGLNSVLVEVDRAEDLKAAYPNYFLDVGLFVEKLRGLIYPAAPKPRISTAGVNLDWVKEWFQRTR
jgi:hypothetical protein